MKKFLKHNDTSLKTIEKYVLNKMSTSEKNAFEKQMLEDDFLKEAVEGYQNQPEAINYFKTNLNKSKILNFNLYLILGIFAIMISFLFWQNNQNQKIAQTSISYQKQPSSDQIEIIPVELETLTVISKAEQIDQTRLVETQKHKKQFDEVQTKKNKHNDSITLIDLPDFDVDDSDQITIPIKTKKQIFPTVYYYDLEVLDYRIFDNSRGSTINKKTYVQTGLSANFENENTQNKYDLVEREIQVPYIDYLKESMAYFSRDNYKKALQRFNVILEHYPNDFNALFYGGLSNYNLGRFQKALTNFNKLIEEPNQPFYEDALWYSAQINIKLNEVKKAKLNLEVLILESEYYRTDAINLLKTIK